MEMNPMLLKDFYKSDHRRQYPEGTSYVYSNWTPRSTRMPEVKEVVFFGLQYFLKEYLIRQWNENFFERKLSTVLEEYEDVIVHGLGPDPFPMEHVTDLHNLGYLPLEIRALSEGVKVPLGVPMFTIVNTHSNFYWLTNMIESVMSNVLWKPSTSATIAHEYWREFKRHQVLTGGPEDFIPWQGHDFSFRGMSGLEDACLSGAGHALFFTGSDTIPVIPWMRDYYHADLDGEQIVGSVPATEHSVMSMHAKYGEEIDEFETFKYLITELYPTGVISIVSDTFDLWKVLTNYLPRLKNEILNRDGRVVIRPDSGDPVHIVCGTDSGERDDGVQQQVSKEEQKGVYELLHETFPGPLTDKGFKQLDPHVGVIYGDAITLNRQHDILSGLEGKGFCASNLVLGIGSYTYVHQTRDVFGFAMKATAGGVVINDEVQHRVIFKKPKTDRGIKTSAKGLLQVHKDGDGYYLNQECINPDGGELTTVFKDSELYNEVTLSEIRKRIRG